MQYSDVKKMLESAIKLTKVMQEAEKIRDNSIENANDTSNVFWSVKEQERWESNASKYETARANAHSELKRQFVILNQLINCE